MLINMGHGFHHTNMTKRFMCFSSGEDVTQQTGRRTDRVQPKARRRHRSPIRPVSASSSQTTALSSPTAVDEHTDKTTPQYQAEEFKNTA